MSKFKLPLTILVIVVCAVISFISLGFYLTNEANLRYQAQYESEMPILSMSLRDVSDAFDGYYDTEYKYYEVIIHVMNPINVDKNESNIFLSYYSADEEGYYYIQEVEEPTFFSYDNYQLIPGGKEAVVTRVIAVEKDCSKIEVQHMDHSIHTIQKYYFDL